MSEKYVLVEEEEIGFNGIFSYKEVLALMDKFFNERGYDKQVVSQVVQQDLQQVQEEVHELNFIYVKKYSDYAKGEIEINIKAILKEKVVAEIEGEKRNMDKGEISIIFGPVALITDYENRWEKLPFTFVIRWFVDNFLTKRYITLQKNELMRDYSDLKAELSSFLGIKEKA